VPAVPTVSACRPLLCKRNLSSTCEWLTIYHNLLSASTLWPPTISVLHFTMKAQCSTAFLARYSLKHRDICLREFLTSSRIKDRDQGPSQNCDAVPVAFSQEEYVCCYWLRQQRSDVWLGKSILRAGPLQIDAFVNGEWLHEKATCALAIKCAHR
jgi:hypothetical protein